MSGNHNEGRKLALHGRLKTKHQQSQNKKQTELQSTDRICNTLQKNLSHLAPVQFWKSLYLNEQATIESMAKKLQKPARESITAIDKNIELSRKAQYIFNEGLILLKIDNYAEALAKMLEAARLADEGNSTDVSIKIHRYIMLVALKTGDLATALIQSEVLKDLTNLLTFEKMFDENFAETFGTVLESKHESEIYLVLALTLLYKGNIKDAVIFLNKINIKRLGMNDVWQLTKKRELEAVLTIILPYLKKFTKQQSKEGLRAVNAVLTMLEQEGAQYIEQAAFEKFALIQQDLFTIISFFNLEDQFKAKDNDNEYRMHYLCFKHQQAEINIHWGQALLAYLQKITGVGANNTNIISVEHINKAKENCRLLLVKAVDYAKNTNNRTLTYLAAAALTELYAWQLKNDEAVNKEYFAYVAMRNQAAKKIKNKDLISRQTPQTTHIKILQLATISPVVPADLADDGHVEASSPEQNYLAWQKEYNAIVAKITTSIPTDVIAQLNLLLDKCRHDLHRKAQVLYGLAAVHYFNVCNFLVVIEQLKKRLTAIKLISLNYRKKEWKILETEFAAVKEKIQTQTANLKVAQNFINEATECCNNILEKNLIPSQGIEFDNYKQLVNSIIESGGSITLALEATMEVVQGFIQEMEDKKDYLISIGKYGKGTKRAQTSEIVKIYLEQDALLNNVHNATVTLIEKTEDIAEIIVLRDKLCGVWLTSRGDAAKAIEAYEEAYHYYLEAVQAYKKAKQPRLVAMAEWQLAWVSAMLANQEDDLTKKAELVQKYLAHLNNTLQQYKQLNTHQQYSGNIVQIETDIDKGMQLQQELQKQIAINVIVPAATNPSCPRLKC
jgi:hypothetical protein